MLTEEQKQAILDESAHREKVPTVDASGRLDFVVPVKGYGKTTRPKDRGKRKRKRHMTRASRRKNR